jgi:hypothetical protein
LNGAGAYVSVDYRSATDNIIQEYVDAAVQVLLEKSVGLTVEEVECLRVLSSIKFDDPAYADRHHTRGQPMGSLISFPLLCLINKTVVDLAAQDMLACGELTISEFRRHRCLINGDDLLFREPHAGSGSLLAGIIRHGRRVGLVVNDEKTMVDEEYAEINSTLFHLAKQQKKTNCAALFMGRDESDVLGFAASACRSREGFRMCVSRALRQLAGQPAKLYGPLPSHFFKVLCRGDRDMKAAIRSVPISERPKAANLFPVCPLPDGYDLTWEEEIETIDREVVRLREGGGWRAILDRPSFAWPQTAECPDLSVSRALRKRNQRLGEVTLTILSRRWEEKVRSNALASDHSLPAATPLWRPWDDSSCAQRIMDYLRECKNRTITGQPSMVKGKEGVMPCAWSEDFVSLATD